MWIPVDGVGLPGFAVFTGFGPAAVLVVNIFVVIKYGIFNGNTW
jgi:hypothetical protein